MFGEAPSRGDSWLHEWCLNPQVPQQALRDEAGECFNWIFSFCPSVWHSILLYSALYPGSSLWAAPMGSLTFWLLFWAEGRGRDQGTSSLDSRHSKLQGQQPSLTARMFRAASCSCACEPRGGCDSLHWTLSEQESLSSFVDFP